VDNSNDIEILRDEMIKTSKEKNYNFLNKNVQKISRKLDRLIIKEMFRTD
jgi:hypothetical protein